MLNRVTNILNSPIPTPMPDVYIGSLWAYAQGNTVYKVLDILTYEEAKRKYGERLIPNSPAANDAEEVLLVDEHYLSSDASEVRNTLVKNTWFVCTQRVWSINALPGEVITNLTPEGLINGDTVFTDDAAFFLENHTPYVNPDRVSVGNILDAPLPQEFPRVGSLWQYGKNSGAIYRVLDVCEFRIARVRYPDIDMYFDFNTLAEDDYVVVNQHIKRATEPMLESLSHFYALHKLVSDTTQSLSSQALLRQSNVLSLPLPPEYPKVGSVWRHNFTGNTYTVIACDVYKNIKQRSDFNACNLDFVDFSDSFFVDDSMPCVVSQKTDMVVENDSDFSYRYIERLSTFLHRHAQLVDKKIKNANILNSPLPNDLSQHLRLDSFSDFLTFAKEDDIIWFPHIHLNLLYIVGRRVSAMYGVAYVMARPDFVESLKSAVKVHPNFITTYSDVIPIESSYPAYIICRDCQNVDDSEIWDTFQRCLNAKQSDTNYPDGVPTRQSNISIPIISDGIQRERERERERDGIRFSSDLTFDALVGKSATANILNSPLPIHVEVGSLWAWKSSRGTTYTVYLVLDTCTYEEAMNRYERTLAHSDVARDIYSILISDAPEHVKHTARQTPMIVTRYAPDPEDLTVGADSDPDDDRVTPRIYLDDPQFFIDNHVPYVSSTRQSNILSNPLPDFIPVAHTHEELCAMSSPNCVWWSPKYSKYVFVSLDTELRTTEFDASQLLGIWVDRVVLEKYIQDPELRTGNFSLFYLSSLTSDWYLVSKDLDVDGYKVFDNQQLANEQHVRSLMPREKLKRNSHQHQANILNSPLPYEYPEVGSVWEYGKTTRIEYIVVATCLFSDLTVGLSRSAYDTIDLYSDTPVVVTVRRDYLSGGMYGSTYYESLSHFLKTHRRSRKTLNTEANILSVPEPPLWSVDPEDDSRYIFEHPLSFDQLPPDVQEKALNENRGFNTDYMDWWDGSLDFWREKLTNMGFDNPEINFSLSYSQGDGASFTANVNVQKFMTVHRCRTQFAPLYRNSDFLSCRIYRTDHHYYHENTVGCECNWDGNERYAELVNDFEALVTERVWILSRAIYKSLVDEYEYLTSDAALKESFVDNSYVFDAQGKMAGQQSKNIRFSNILNLPPPGSAELHTIVHDFETLVEHLSPGQVWVSLPRLADARGNYVEYLFVARMPEINKSGLDLTGCTWTTHRVLTTVPDIFEPQQLSTLFATVKPEVFPLKLVAIHNLDTQSSLKFTAFVDFVGSSEEKVGVKVGNVLDLPLPPREFSLGTKVNTILALYEHLEAGQVWRSLPRYAGRTVTSMSLTDIFVFRKPSRSPRLWSQSGGADIYNCEWFTYVPGVTHVEKMYDLAGVARSDMPMQLIATIDRHTTNDTPSMSGRVSNILNSPIPEEMSVIIGGIYKYLPPLARQNSDVRFKVLDIIPMSEVNTKYPDVTMEGMSDTDYDTYQEEVVICNGFIFSARHYGEGQVPEDRENTEGNGHPDDGNAVSGVALSAFIAQHVLDTDIRLQKYVTPVRHALVSHDVLGIRFSNILNSPTPKQLVAWTGELSVYNPQQDNVYELIDRGTHKYLVSSYPQAIDSVKLYTNTLAYNTDAHEAAGELDAPELQCVALTFLWSPVGVKSVSQTYIVPVKIYRRSVVDIQYSDLPPEFNGNQITSSYPTTVQSNVLNLPPPEMEVNDIQEFISSIQPGQLWWSLSRHKRQENLATPTTTMVWEHVYINEGEHIVRARREWTYLLSNCSWVSDSAANAVLKNHRLSYLPFTEAALIDSDFPMRLIASAMPLAAQSDLKFSNILNSVFPPYFDKGDVIIWGTNLNDISVFQIYDIGNLSDLKVRYNGINCMANYETYIPENDPEYNLPHTQRLCAAIKSLRTGASSDIYFVPHLVLSVFCSRAEIEDLPENIRSKVVNIRQSNILNSDFPPKSSVWYIVWGDTPGITTNNVYAVVDSGTLSYLKSVYADHYPYAIDTRDNDVYVNMMETRYSHENMQSVEFRSQLPALAIMSVYDLSMYIIYELVVTAKSTKIDFNDLPESIKNRANAINRLRMSNLQLSENNRILDHTGEFDNANANANANDNDNDNDNQVFDISGTRYPRHSAQTNTDGRRTGIAVTNGLQFENLEQETPARNSQTHTASGIEYAAGDAQIEIRYPTVDQLLAVHEEVLDQWGGTPGYLGDAPVKLETAIARMQSAYFGTEQYPTVVDKAAVLIHSIITSHPFMDANKRTAVIGAKLFMQMNDYTFPDNPILEDGEDIADVAIQMAEGDKDHERARAWLRDNHQWYTGDDDTEETEADYPPGHWIHKLTTRIPGFSGIRFSNILGSPLPEEEDAVDGFKFWTNKDYPSTVIAVLYVGDIQSAAQRMPDARYSTDAEMTLRKLNADFPEVVDKVVCYTSSANIDTIFWRPAKMTTPIGDRVYRSFLSQFVPRRNHDRDADISVESNILNSPLPEELPHVGEIWQLTCDLREHHGDKRLWLVVSVGNFLDIKDAYPSGVVDTYSGFDYDDYNGDAVVVTTPAGYAREPDIVSIEALPVFIRHNRLVNERTGTLQFANILNTPLPPDSLVVPGNTWYFYDMPEYIKFVCTLANARQKYPMRIILLGNSVDTELHDPKLTPYADCTIVLYTVGNSSTLLFDFVVDTVVIDGETIPSFVDSNYPALAHTSNILNSPLPRESEFAEGDKVRITMTISEIQDVIDAQDFDPEDYIPSRLVNATGVIVGYRHPETSFEYYKIVFDSSAVQGMFGGWGFRPPEFVKISDTPEHTPGHTPGRTANILNSPLPGDVELGALNGIEEWASLLDQHSATLRIIVSGELSTLMTNYDGIPNGGTYTDFRLVDANRFESCRSQKIVIYRGYHDQQLRWRFVDYHPDIFLCRSFLDDFKPM